VKDNWDAYIATPYNSWDTNRLQSYLTSRGQDVKKRGEQNKENLVSQVQATWHETGDQATDAYSNVKDWIFDTYALPLSDFSLSAASPKLIRRTQLDRLPTESFPGLSPDPQSHPTDS
jgi:hypothetical protein